jgi:hypothetical protein
MCASIRYLTLAARVLLEWKTPCHAPEYRYVLERIIAAHPFAERYLNGSRRIFEYDSHGALLGYLCETIDTRELFIDKHLVLVRASTKIIFWMDQVLTRTHLGTHDEELWEGGPLLSQTIEAIWLGLHQDAGGAAKALLSLAIPFEDGLHRRFVEPIVTKYQAEVGGLRKLSARIRRLRAFVGGCGVAAYSLCIAGGPAILAGMIVMFKGHRASGLWSILLSLVILVTAFVLGGWLGALEWRWDRDEFGMLFGVALQDLIERRKRAAESNEVDQLIGGTIRELVRMSAHEAGVFTGVLKDLDGTAWAALLLGVNEELSSSVVSELALLFRGSRLDNRTKYRIFVRLATSK